MCGKHFVTLAILLSGFFAQRVEGQCNCPTPVGLTQRATSPSPYQYVGDRLVTDSDLPSGLDLQDKSQSSSIAIGTGFLIGIAFESVRPSGGNGIFLTRWNVNGTRRCSCFNQPFPDPPITDDLVIRLDDPGTAGQHSHVSIAARRPLAIQDISSCNGNSLFACWQATDNTSNDAPELMQLSQPLSLFPGQFGPPFIQATFNNTVGQVSVQGIDTNDIAPSAGLSCNIDSVLKWESASANDMRANSSPNHRGLLRLFNTTTTGELVRCCGGSTTPCNTESCAAQFQQYRPSVIHKGDGTQFILWSEKDIPGFATPFFNIALRAYRPDGSLAVQIDRESLDSTRTSVNEPMRDMSFTDQQPGTLDVDPCGNLVSVWCGPMPRGLYPDQPCESDEFIAVYARRMLYIFDEESGLASIQFLSHQFRCDTSGSEWTLGTDLSAVHPTVAIRQFVKFQDPGGNDQVQGVFCVAWNAIHRVSGQKSVRGQFFHGDGRPFGAEFDLSPYKDANGDPDGIDRTLAESNQHTMQLVVTGGGNHGDLFATWTADDGTNKNVWFTKVEVEFLSDTENGWEASTGECIKGDCDGDGLVFDVINDIGDIGDIPPFIDLLLDDPENTLKCDSYVQWQPTMDMVYCRADTNNDGVVTAEIFSVLSIFTFTKMDRAMNGSFTASSVAAVWPRLRSPIAMKTTLAIRRTSFAETRWTAIATAFRMNAT